MNFTVVIRFLLALTFMTTGFIKSRRFGKKLTPELWEDMAEEFRKMDKGLKDFPGRENFKVTPAQAQEFFAYLDFICGFLLLTGNLTGLASCLLLIEMVGLEYTLFIMNYPIQIQGIVIGIAVALLSSCAVGGRKEKED